jgi:hypothetical protein
VKIAAKREHIADSMESTAERWANIADSSDYRWDFSANSSANSASSVATWESTPVMKAYS